MPAGDTLANRHTLLAAPTPVIAHGMCQCIQLLSMFGVARRGRLRAPGEGTLDGTMRRCFVAGLLFSDWKVLV